MNHVEAHLPVSPDVLLLVLPDARSLCFAMRMPDDSMAGALTAYGGLTIF